MESFLLLYIIIFIAVVIYLIKKAISSSTPSNHNLDRSSNDYSRRNSPETDKVFRPSRNNSRANVKTTITFNDPVIPDKKSSIITCEKCEKKLRIPSNKSGIVICPSCNHKFSVTKKLKESSQSPTSINFEGINDAFSGVTIDPKKTIYGCTCGVFYHASSYEVIKSENNYNCVACSMPNISLFGKGKTKRKERVRNHNANLVTLSNYKQFFNRVVTFEGKVHNILQSRSGTSYAVMFENKSWTKGFKLVFFRDAVSQYGGPRYIYSLKGKTIKVRGLLIKHQTFGDEIMINERAMMLSVR